jgi:hypothetical protein
MIYETGNRILDRMERRFGGLALPRVLRWIAGFQVLSWVLAFLSPGFLEWLVFDRSLILGGEVWRLFSWVVFPAAKNPLFVLIAALFLFFINDGLESEWDSFRLNVYVFASIGMLCLAGLLPISAGAGLLLNGILYSAVFLAFATLFPEQVIHLLGIIPIKAKWLGWANAALLAGMVLTSPAPLIVGTIVAMGLAPYAMTFAPGFVESFRRESAAKVRRHQFERELDGGDSFHRCAACGATEKSHPRAEFRVAADGEEYCDACRKGSEAG